MRALITLIIIFATSLTSFAQRYVPSNEKPPMFPREFRGAWVACVYNIDWPSRPGLSAYAQKAELLKIIQKADELNLNAIIFQVRPNADAVYRSALEPWSHWVSGRMGKSPGYDPLAYCITEAHKRGIEVHAWFNPFRALPNKDIPTSSNHITRTHPSSIKLFKSYKWMNPSLDFTRQRAITVMLDVTRRYDVDGIHIDDYFYPYPDVIQGRPKQIFPDGRTPAQRRAVVDAFVKQMYTSIKQTKPWVRVGISPFGIWRPGVPAGTTASIDAYEHLAADSRKWLRNGWCDYLSPQLYWRIAPRDQSFTALLSWWRSQGKRPVWPGIATSRINSKEDPGRPASEILKQVNLTRTIGKNWAGSVHWSMKSLMTNRGGISTALKKGAYRVPALVPPMTWMQGAAPGSPTVAASLKNTFVHAKWNRVPSAHKYAVQARYGNQWSSLKITPSLGINIGGKPNAIAITAVDRYGKTGLPTVLTLVK